MPESISWSWKGQVLGGAQASAAQIETFDAVTDAQVVVDPNTTKVCLVQLAGTGKIRFLALRADHYKNLTYKAKDGASLGHEIDLDGPQLFASAGLKKLFKEEPRSLSFKNDSTEKVTIQILAGWMT